MRIVLGTLLAIVLTSGCDRSSAPPPPLSMEQLPAALEKAFARSSGEGKDLAGEVVASVRASNYSKAYAGLRMLIGTPGLTKEQTSITTRGMLTINGVLQSAQAQGDQKAAETLKEFRKIK